jgi:hypothetical protein
MPLYYSKAMIDGFYCPGDYLSCNCILASSKVHIHLGLLESLLCGFTGRKLASDCAGLFSSEIERQVLLSLVEDTQVVALCLRHDGENTGD